MLGLFAAPFGPNSFFGVPSVTNTGVPAKTDHGLASEYGSNRRLAFTTAVTGRSVGSGNGYRWLLIAGELGAAGTNWWWNHGDNTNERIILNSSNQLLVTENAATCVVAGDNIVIPRRFAVGIALGVNGTAFCRVAINGAVAVNTTPASDGWNGWNAQFLGSSGFPTANISTTKVSVLAYGEGNLSLDALVRWSKDPWRVLEPDEIRVFYTSGGAASYTDSLTDTAGATDTATAGLVAINALADAGAATDTTTALLIGINALADAGAATDAATGALTIAVAVSDAGAATDAATAVLVGLDAITDAGAATDAASSVATLINALADSAAATDVSTGSLGAATYTEALADSAAATDSASCSAVLTNALADSADAAEVMGCAAVLADLLADLAAGSDIVVVGLVATHALADVAAATDSATGTVGSQTYTDALADSAAATDTMTALDILSQHGTRSALGAQIQSGRRTAAGTDTRRSQIQRSTRRN